MKYPYIGEAKNGSVVLFYGSETGLSLNDDAGSASFGSLIGQCLESEFFNITAEYLVNTYGEVKSKEHAEFIRKLCEVNGISVNEHPSNLDTHFVILNNILHYCYSKPSVEVKQITIPLPPECESADEWPKVGDTVLTASKSKAKVLATHNKKAWVEYVSGAHGFNTLNIASLSKPKTPEQELREDIIKTIHDDVYNGMYGKESFDIFADALMAKYNITKKGEGDE